MTRKDYKLIAEALRSAFNHLGFTPEQKQLLVDTLAWWLANENPKFDSNRFEAAILGQK
ncbi:MAG: hypothetical protein DDT19_00266 [Syntrophomonadaceae bacterium]|nr:hypothetical protein [Bacillota bacterium]